MTYAVDTGFIVYNESTYPEFTRLPAEMSFGLACERTGLEWSSRGLRGIFATRPQSLRPPFLRMLAEIARFAREAPQGISSLDPKLTLRELVARGGYSDAFRDGYLAPMGAAIWSAATQDLLDMPAASFIRFFSNHGLLGRGGGVRWRTLKGGSKVYVDALARRIRGTISLSTPVLGIASTPAGVLVTIPGETRTLDRVVLAVHSDTALSLLSSPTTEQRRILGAIRYSRNETLLHTDASVLPRRPAARASWNYRVPDREDKAVLVTYDLSRLQSIPSAEPLLVTLNGSSRIHPKHILARFDYAHPILDCSAIDARAQKEFHVSPFLPMSHEYRFTLEPPAATLRARIENFARGELVFDANLEAAQTAKYERLCQKLDLRASHHLLEIGTGWGGFALHAARTRGCRVTTTTISREQFALARERIARAGLDGRIEVLLEDYRDLRGQYDRLVSIEMIEAVGHRHLPRFFEVCANRLAADGAMALQAILVPEQSWEHSKKSVDFIKRYILPGGQLVGLGAISQAITKTALRLVHYEDITPHYAETLRRWRDRFLASRGEITALGMDERFFRTWEFYLAYCEGAFHERVNLAAQLVFENGGGRRNSILGALEILEEQSA